MLGVGAVASLFYAVLGSLWLATAAPRNAIMQGSRSMAAILIRAALQLLLSLLLSWGVKDLAAPLVIACLPLQSSRGKIVAKVLTGALGLLSP